MSKQEVYAAKSAFELAQAAYESFREQHADVIEEHDHLCVALTEAVEAYKTVVRDNHELLGRNHGPFTIIIPRSLNVDALRKALGDDAKYYLKESYTVDSKAFTNAVESGRIPRHVADKVEGVGAIRISGGPKAPTIYQR